MEPFDPKNLTGSQRSALRAALVSAYRRADLQMLISERLNRSWEDLVREGGTKEDQVFDLIETSQREGWIDALIKEAVAGRSNSNQIGRLKVTLGLMAPTLPPASAASGPALSLERMIATSKMRDFSDLVALQGRICRVEAGRFAGTGFLVADDLVLTNYHVIEQVKDGDGR